MTERISTGGLLVLALLAAACSGRENEARTELERLDGAVRRHAQEHGRFPETLDAARPAGPTNLPHAFERDVQLIAFQGTEENFQASARDARWICSVGGTKTQRAQPQCYPASGAPGATPDSAAGPGPMLEPTAPPDSTP